MTQKPQQGTSSLIAFSICACQPRNGCEIVLVQPYAKSGGTCVGATEQPPFEFPGSIGVRAKWRRNRQGRAFDADIAQTR